MRAQFVVGGLFRSAGGIEANHIAMYDAGARSWTALGSGMNDAVTALAVLPNGDLLAGGWFTTAGTAHAPGLARWDGKTWSAVGGGAQGAVVALAILANGHIVVGQQGRVSGWHLDIWDGEHWRSLGAALDGYVNALAVGLDGSLIVGGTFHHAGGREVLGIARWDGTSWSPLGSGMSGGWNGTSVRSLGVLPGGDIVACGRFASADGRPVQHIARWDGARWHSVGGGVSGGLNFGDTEVNAVSVLADGSVLVGGEFTAAGGIPAERMARWDGNAWHALGTGCAWTVFCLAHAGQQVLAGGRFTRAGGTVAFGTATWDDHSWTAAGSGVAGTVYALAVLPNGVIAMGGEFEVGGPHPGHSIAVWDGDAVACIGSGMTQVGYDRPVVRSLAVLPNGDLLAGGRFSSAGGVTLQGLARWDGTAWSAVGGSMAGGPVAVNALLVLRNGDVIAAGSFQTAGGVAASSIARWDGASWHPLGAGIVGEVFALAEMPNGDLVVGGSFSRAGNTSSFSLARWDGSQWHAMSANDRVLALVVVPNGDLLAAGWFSVIGESPVARFARWDGQTWSQFGGAMGTPIQAMTVLPDGDLVVAGYFLSIGGVTAQRIARWDGAGWHAFGTGVGLSNYGNHVVQVLTVAQNAEVVVGGEFPTAGGRSACNLARFHTCLGAYSTFGRGCPGTLPIARLTTPSLPRIGSNLVVEIDNLPQDFVVLMTGRSHRSNPGRALPARLDALGMPGCWLRVDPDLLLHASGSGGTARLTLPIPDDPGLIGLRLYQQALVPDPEANSAGIVVSDAAAAALGR